jgi:hypothetical protein
MPNAPISGLPAAGPLTGTEPTPVVQGGVTRRTTTGAIWAKTFISPAFFGAVGDGVTDDSAALQAADAAAFAAGLPVILTARYRVAAPVNCSSTWQGAFNPKEDQTHDPADVLCALVIDPAATINLQNGAAVRNVFAVKFGLTKAISQADALAQIAAFSGTAFTAAGSDVYLTEVMAMGFAVFFLGAGFERPHVERCYFDCTNGVALTNVSDVARVIENEGFPFYSVHQFSDIATGSRAGAAYQFHDVVDGAIIVSNFSYGYATSFFFRNVFAQRIVGNLCDNTISTAAALNTVGFQTEGICNALTFSDNHADSHNQNFLFNHTDGMVGGGVISSGQSAAAQIVVGATATIAFAVAMIGGGSTACITFLPGRTTLAFVGVVQLTIGTKAGPAFVFNAADAPQIAIRTVGLNGQATTDNFTNGTVAAPAYSNQQGSGISFDGAGSVYISIGRKEAALFLAESNPVNFLAFRATNTGDPLAIFANGADANIPIIIAPGGAGALVVQGVASTDAAARLLVAGATHALRVGTTATEVRLEGTDQTGVGSFQPILVGGSVVELQAAGNPVQVTLSGNLLSAIVPIKTLTTTVAGLPPAGTVGARAFVTDSTVTMAAGVGLPVVGGAANKVPVFDDGVSWKIG